MRAINLRPSGTWRLALALLPFLLLLLAYVIGSNMRLAANPNDKLLPSFADMGETIYAYAFEPDPRTGDLLAVVGHGGEPDAAPDRARDLGHVRPRDRHHDRPAADRRGDLRAGRRGAIDGSAARAACRSCSSSWGLGEASKITLIVIGTTLKLIRDIALARRRYPARAADQGADARRLQRADRLAHRAAADPAPADRRRTASRSGRPGCS